MPQDNPDEIVESFSITRKEADNGKTFWYHKCLALRSQKIQYAFDTLSGIGMRKIMRCLTCLKEHDITDYDAW